MYTELTIEEQEQTNGGSLTLIAIAVGYACFAAGFCYQLGKD